MHQRKLVLTAAAAAALAVVPAGSAFAAAPDRAEAPFVCPVLTISDQAAANSDRFTAIGNGQYTFAPGAAGSAETFNGNVPNHATNADGSGSPGGTHSAPGDSDYSAIWSGNN
jgi:ABC-type phosphate transport system substrate-binding protein